MSVVVKSKPDQNVYKKSEDSITSVIQMILFQKICHKKDKKKKEQQLEADVESRKTFFKIEEITAYFYIDENDLVGG